MKICPKCGKEYQDATTLCPADGTVLKKAGDDLIGQTLAGKYRVEETISEGGMGTVYRGTHILIDKTVAIKVLHPALAADDKIVARFSREAKAASRISHPHALNVTDFGESENGVVFLVMEYLRGRTLKEVIQSEGAMPLPRIVEIMRQVGSALDAAHAEGIVHRDLKSDNIMLVDGNGDSDWAKVLDFGIAKIQEPVGQDPALTAPNLIIGTPQYMSPEQCSQASEIDARSDVYSLGVILFEMLVGHVPFAGESPTAIMMKHLQEPPPSVLDERKDLPAAAGRVVARAMAKRPEDRYQSAGELVEALSLAAANETPAAALTDAGPAAADRSTKRIVVPTDPNMPSRGTTNEGYDETTVIRPRPDPAVAAQAAYSQTGPPPESFNPWRIIIPAAAGLLVIFAVIYAVTRNAKQPAANEQATPLTVDPNSQPVRPAQPATGQGEQGITSKVPGASPSPTLNANIVPNTNTVSNTNAASNVNQNRNANASSRRGNSNANDTSDTAQNDNTANENEAQPSPTATPPSKNSNRQRELPSPQTSPTTSVPPPPSTTPRKPPALPKATPPPETTPRPTQPEAGP